MSDMVPEVLNAALDSLFTPKEPGEQEYQGVDGLLYCRNCHSTDRHDSGAAAFRSVRLSESCRSEDSDRAAKAACYIVRCRQSPQLAIFCVLWQVHMLEVWRRTAV